jgi:methionyl-tRNA formyltransferase
MIDASTYVLATSRPWYENLATRLARRTGRHFVLITRKEDLTIERLRTLSPRYVFFPHWSYLIPEEIHTQFECVMFHMTDLPYGRGGSPLQNLILRKREETQITAFRCVAELDAGPIYFKRPLCLHGSSAYEIFSRAARIIESMIETIIEKQPEPIPQQGQVVMFQRRKPFESDLLRAQISDIEDIYDFIRMLDCDGYPRAFLDFHDYRIEFSRVHQEFGKLVGTFVIYKKEKVDGEDCSTHGIGGGGPSR